MFHIPVGFTVGLAFNVTKSHKISMKSMKIEIYSSICHFFRPFILENNWDFPRTAIKRAKTVSQKPQEAQINCLKQ